MPGAAWSKRSCRTLPAAAVAMALAVQGAAQVTTPGTEPLGPPPPPRPGRFRVGPVYLTPTLHIGTVGLDTNVFYTAADRRTDVSGSGGPGLQLVLPLGGDGKFFAEGNLDYLYFVKTESQRKLRWNGNGGFDVLGTRTRFHLEEAYAETFGRPSYEVDERIKQTEEGTRLDLKRRLFGRLAVRVFGSRAKFEADAGQTYLGNDLRRTLTRDEYRALGGLDYLLSVKTSFVVEGEREWDRFPLDRRRDADSDRLWAGFRTDDSALISGHALVGVRWFRPKSSPGFVLRRTIADVDATWNVSPKTHITGQYGRDLSFSAYETSGLTPTVLNERYGARIEKDLGGHFDVRIFGRVTKLATDGDITLELPDQPKITAPRNDKAREVGLDFGYRFRPRFRVGVAATYVDRKSNIAYFGIDGLLVGGTVQFTP